MVSIGVAIVVREFYFYMSPFEATPRDLFPCFFHLKNVITANKGGSLASF